MQKDPCHMNGLPRRLLFTSLLVATFLVARAPTALALMDGNPKNGLSSDSFLRNALTTNPDALVLLRSLPLSPILLGHPTIHLQLNERGARAVMEELVKCALAPDTSLTYVDDGGGRWLWRGELGLCQQPQLPVGDWTAAAPTTQCQELVTACLMARVNGLDKSIPLSLRGEPDELFPVRSSVAMEPNLREARRGEDPTDGTPIESFRWPLCPVGHECRWAQAYVGTCKPGTVALAIDSPDACDTTPIRVCAGIHGCYGPSSPVGYPSEVPYSRYVQQQTGACRGATLVFSCPGGVGTAGFYSVMLRRSTSGGLTAPPPPPPVIKVAGAGSYPATEAEVFSYVEGAFYGNLFSPDELAIRCHASPTSPTVLLCQRADGSAAIEPCAPAATACPQRRLTVPYRNVYACYSLTRDGTTDDTAAVAYMNDRICAQRNGDEPCFPHPPQRCSLHCEWDAAGGRYQRCTGGLRTPTAPKVYPAITTYLNDPCDLIGGAALCTRLRTAIGLAGNGGGGVTAGPPTTRRPRGCGGCASADEAPAPLTAALALLLSLGGLRARRG